MTAILTFLRDDFKERGYFRDEMIMLMTAVPVNELFLMVMCKGVERCLNAKCLVIIQVSLAQWYLYEMKQVSWHVTVPWKTDKDLLLGYRVSFFKNKLILY